MRTQCLDCKRHVYDLDEMSEYCLFGCQEKEYCAMYEKRTPRKRGKVPRRIDRMNLTDYTSNHGM